MGLKFPNARLVVCNELFKHDGDCVTAIIAFAEMGLIAVGSLKHIEFPLNSRSCGSMFAARLVVQECLTSRGLAQHIDDVWQQIEQDIEAHKRENKIVHEREQNAQPAKLECNRMAQVVADYMLQALVPFL